MNTVKKGLCISFGVLFFILGIVSALVFIISGNIDLTDKLIAVSLSIAVAIFGWWLLRRGSNSVMDAIGWILAQIIPIP